MYWLKILGAVVPTLALILSVGVFLVSTSSDSEAMAVKLENRVTTVENQVKSYEGVDSRLRQLETHYATSNQIMINLGRQLTDLNKTTKELRGMVPDVAILKSQVSDIRDAVKRERL